MNNRHSYQMMLKYICNVESIMVCAEPGESSLKEREAKMGPRECRWYVLRKPKLSQRAQILTSESRPPETR